MNFIMNFQTALLVTLVGIVASAPISDKLNIMDKDTIEQAHSLINKILKDIPTTHAAWIKTLTLGDSMIRQQLDYLRKESMKIPPAPVLQNISSISSMETCLAQIVVGLRLHLNLLKEVSKATTLGQTDQVKGLQADIRDLLFLIKKLQNQAGFDPSEQSQPPMHDLDKHLSSEYLTQVAAHLILQQLQDFSYDVLRSILSIRSMTEMAENPNTVQLSVNPAAV